LRARRAISRSSSEILPFSSARISSVILKIARAAAGRGSHLIFLKQVGQHRRIGLSLRATQPFYVRRTLIALLS